MSEENRPNQPLWPFAADGSAHPQLAGKKKREKPAKAAPEKLTVKDWADSHGLPTDQAAPADAPPLLLNHQADAALPPAVAQAVHDALAPSVAQIGRAHVINDPDAAGTLIHLSADDLQALRDSPFQPRTRMNAEKLASLTADVAANGVLQPLVFRRLQLDDGAEVRELIFGHRRKAAAIAARLASVPAIEQPMSDAEVLVAQMAENREREELSPLDEARGYRQLRQLEGIDAKAVAARMGVSARTVFQRLQLLELVPEAQAALEAGEIGAEVASYIARVSRVHQAAALKIAQEKDWRGKPRYSSREVRSELMQKFSLDLKDAPWALDDATLLPSAGACSTCPKRCGAQPELFADVLEDGQLDDDSIDEQHLHGVPLGPDVCPEPACFADKKDAHQRRLADELAAKTGATVIAGKDAARALKVSQWSKTAEIKGKDFVPLADVKAELKKLPRDAKPETVILLADNGAKVEAVRTKDLQAAGVQVEKRLSPQQQYDKQRERREAEDRKRAEKAAHEGKVRMEIWQQLVANIGQRPRSTEELRLIVTKLAKNVYGDQSLLVTQALDLPARAGLSSHQIAALSPDRLGVLAVLCAVAGEVRTNPYMTDLSCPSLEAIATANGVDVAGIRAQHAQASDPTTQAAPPAKSEGGKAAKGKKTAAAKAAGGKKKQAPAARGKK